MCGENLTGFIRRSGRRVRAFLEVLHTGTGCGEIRMEGACPRRTLFRKEDEKITTSEINLKNHQEI